jgi:hypothetical protein
MGVERLGERINPVTFTWTGAASTGVWSQNGNWDLPGYPGNGSGQTAKFDGLPTGNKEPILFGQTIHVHELIITNNWTANDFIDLQDFGGASSTLICDTSNMVGSSTIKGDGGTLELGVGTHTIDGVNLKMKTVETDYGTYATISGGGWIVGTGGGGFNVRDHAEVLISGNHTAGYGVTIYSGGDWRVTDNAGLFHEHALDPSNGVLHTFHNLGAVTILSGKTFQLSGLRYTQYLGELNVKEFGALSIGNNYAYYLGTRGYADNVDVDSGPVYLYVGSTISTINGDHRYYNSDVYLVTPGYYNTSTQGVVSLNAGYYAGGYGGGYSKVEFNGTSTTINFVNYTYGTNNQQGGAKLSIGGDAWVGGSTHVYSRLVLDGTAGGFDYIQASHAFTIDGSGVNLPGTFKFMSTPAGVPRNDFEYKNGGRGLVAFPPTSFERG